MVTSADVLRALEGIDVATPVADIKVDEPLTKQGIDSLDMATLMLALTGFERGGTPLGGAEIFAVIAARIAARSSGVRRAASLNSPISVRVSGLRSVMVASQCAGFS